MAVAEITRYCYPCFTGVPHLQNIAIKLLMKNTYSGKKEIKLICSAITFHPMQGIIIWKNLYWKGYPIRLHIFYINRHNALFLLSDSFIRLFKIQQKIYRCIVMQPSLLLILNIFIGLNKIDFELANRDKRNFVKNFNGISCASYHLFQSCS